jgi:lysophospholipase L1-like esterase
MTGTKWLWRITGFLGLITTIILIAGFIYGIRTIIDPKGVELPEGAVEQPAADEMQKKDKIQILALGDSLTKGVGDEKGEGYIGKVKQLLEERSDKPVFVWNFAVNGATTENLAVEVNKPTAPEYIKQADVILFTIGGNDLNRIAQTPASSPKPAEGSTTVPSEIRFNYEELALKLPDSEKRLVSIVERLAELNPNAQIVYVGLYHPFLEFDPGRAGAAWIGRWNNAVFQAASKYANVTVVPTYDVFQQHWQDLLSSDHFHPNGAGYEEMAARVMQALK